MCLLQCKYFHQSSNILLLIHIYVIMESNEDLHSGNAETALILVINLFIDALPNNFHYKMITVFSVTGDLKQKRNKTSITGIF